MITIVYTNILKHLLFPYKKIHKILFFYYEIFYQNKIKIKLKIREKKTDMDKPI